MEIFLYIIISTLFVSFLGLIGFITLLLKEKYLNKILLGLVSLSAGALMGGAFLHLLPESAEKISSENLYIIVLLSFIFFFLTEKFLYWRHCHKGNRCDIHTFGYMNLFGDSLHNFIDGLIISATYLTDIRLGLATTFAVVLHEIPQEIGDFGVLLYAGFGKRKALLANFLVALTALFGGILGYFLSFRIEGIINLLLPFAAGGFIYISASDLMPELRKETSLKNSLIFFSIFVLGIVIMFFVRMIGHE